MPSIHLVHKGDASLPAIEVLDRNADLYRSGQWSITPERAATLVGGRVFFHKAQAKPSFFGGEITGFEVTTSGRYAGRIVFTFRFDSVCRNVRAGRNGWAHDKKFVP